MFKAGTDMKYNLPHEQTIQNKHFNNKIRENWLQQQYDENDERLNAPYALQQDVNKRVYGEQQQYQTDFKGQMSYNGDAFRDRMLDQMDTLRQNYGMYGGRNPDFVNQVRDMENYLHFNRPPPLNSLHGYSPYIKNGPLTTYASVNALPPQVIPPTLFPYQAPYIDQDRRMLRTQLIGQK